MVGFRIPNIPFPQDFRFREINSGENARYRYPGYAIDYFTQINLAPYTREVGARTANVEKGTNVFLPIPQQIVDANGIRINAAFTPGALAGGIAEGIAKGDTLTDSLLRPFSGTQAAAQDVINKIGNLETQGLASSIATLLASNPLQRDTTLSQLAQRQAGIVVNPHLSALFEGVDLKRFTLIWNVSPRNPDEAETLQRIIAYVKQRMHPEADTTRSILKYPDVATVEFVNVEGVPPIRRSFISNMTTTYGPSGMALYKDGKPVEYSIQMEFQELEIVTRGDVQAETEEVPRPRPRPTGISSDDLAEGEGV